MWTRELLDVRSNYYFHWLSVCGCDINDSRQKEESFEMPRTSSLLPRRFFASVHLNSQGNSRPPCLWNKLHITDVADLWREGMGHNCDHVLVSGEYLKRKNVFMSSNPVVQKMYLPANPKLRKYLLNLSLPRLTNFEFPLQPHQKYYITHRKELGFS